MARKCRSNARKVNGINAVGVLARQWSPCLQGVSFPSTLAAVLKEDPKPPSQIAKDLPPGLERAIHRCLSKDPARRWQHIEDVKVGLEEVKDESDSGRLPRDDCGPEAAALAAAAGSCGRGYPSGGWGLALAGDAAAACGDGAKHARGRCSD